MTPPLLLAVVMLGLAPPVLAAPIANPVATFSGLDKITARITNFDVYVNETVQFGALQVTPRVCYSLAVRRQSGAERRRRRRLRFLAGGLPAEIGRPAASNNQCRTVRQARGDCRADGRAGEVDDGDRRPDRSETDGAERRTIGLPTKLQSRAKAGKKR